MTFSKSIINKLIVLFGGADFIGLNFVIDNIFRNVTICYRGYK